MWSVIFCDTVCISVAVIAFAIVAVLKLAEYSWNPFLVSLDTHNKCRKRIFYPSMILGTIMLIVQCHSFVGSWIEAIIGGLCVSYLLMVLEAIVAAILVFFSIVFFYLITKLFRG